MGGEPLLHPNLNEILKITRKTLKETNILLFTNALLLNSKNETFWNTLFEENVILVITKYSINIDLNLITNLANKHNVKIVYENNNGK